METEVLKPGSGNPGDPDMGEEFLRALKSYSKLLEKYHRLSDLLRRTTEYREMVPPEVFENVHEDYRKRKAEIEESLERAKGEFSQALKATLAEKKELQEKARKGSHRLKELKFRRILGEYSEEEIEEECRQLRKELGQYAERLNWLDEVLDLYAHTVARTDLEALEEPRPSWREAAVEKTPEPAPAPEPPEASVPTEAHSEAEAKPAGGTPQETTPADAESRVLGQLAHSSYVHGYLVPMDGSRKGQRFPLLAGTITLGSGPGTDIVLPEPGVAKSHARIVYQDRRYMLENLDMLGRTYVNGTQCKASELREGDVIRLGEVKMRVVFSGE